MSLDPAFLITSLVIGSVGFVVFYYGKKQRRIPHMAAGGILMVYPIFVTNVPLVIGIGAAVLALLWLAVRQGF